ncbi:MAG: L-ribulose-5-phosphate 4-epimerase, partial [Cytophagaceae bacterium]
LCVCTMPPIRGHSLKSSDTKTHALLFKEWPLIGGIVHTHSTYATAWAQAQLDIPILGTTHADHLTVDVPCAPPMPDELIAGDYEHQTGWQIIHEFERRGLSPAEVEMILVGNHAPFTWGKTVEKAVYHSAVLEEIARLAYLSITLRADVGRLKDALITKHYQRKHGAGSYYGQS